MTTSGCWQHHSAMLPDTPDSPLFTAVVASPSWSIGTFASKVVESATPLLSQSSSQPFHGPLVDILVTGGVVATFAGVWVFVLLISIACAGSAFLHHEQSLVLETYVGQTCPEENRQTRFLPEEGCWTRHFRRLAADQRHPECSTQNRRSPQASRRKTCWEAE